MKRTFYFIAVIIASFLLYTLFGQCSKAQTTDQDLTPLTIGDTVPDVYLSALLNYNKVSGNLSEFMDKPLLTFGSGSAVPVLKPCLTWTACKKNTKED